MSDALGLGLCLAAGAGLGLFYYGGLRLTVQRLPTARRPELVVLGSFWVRTAITLAAIYLIMDERWERLAACMVGFVALRFLLVRLWKPE